MASIGGLTVDTFEGELSQSEPEERLYKQAGVAGYGTVYGAYRTAGPDIVVTRVRQTTLGNAQTIEAAHRTLNKTMVTVVDPLGRTWTNVEVIGCKTSISNDPLGWIVSSRWKLLPQALAP
jgi:hypothetical protein